MSLYMSKSLIEKINLDVFEDNYFQVSINDQLIKVKKALFKKNKVILKFAANNKILNILFGQKIDVSKIYIYNYENIKFDDYRLISFKHKLEDKTDNYILKLQLYIKDITWLILKQKKN